MTSEVGHALVTGASSGIGAAFARALRARGRNVVLVARREERLRALADALGGANIVAHDLAQPGAAARLHETLRERGVHVDLLVNNAGLGTTGRFWEEAPARTAQLLDVNVRATVELTRCLLPAMVERR